MQRRVTRGWIPASPACTVKGRDSEVVAPGSVLEADEALGKREDAPGRRNHESKVWGRGAHCLWGRPHRPGAQGDGGAVPEARLSGLGILFKSQLSRFWPSDLGRVTLLLASSFVKLREIMTTAPGRCSEA